MLSCNNIYSVAAASRLCDSNGMIKTGRFLHIRNVNGRKSTRNVSKRESKTPTSKCETVAHVDCVGLHPHPLNMRYLWSSYKKYISNNSYTVYHNKITIFSCILAELSLCTHRLKDLENRSSEFRQRTTRSQTGY